VKVAIELEDGIWAMSDYKTSNKEKQGGDTVCLAEEDTQKVNLSTVSAPTNDLKPTGGSTPSLRPDSRKGRGRGLRNRGRGRGRGRNDGRAGVLQLW
jgi:hypothetical protein